jgi:hypothetical protein
MELDNLKALWQDIGQQDIHRDSDEQIMRMLQKRSQSPIAKMKRNLRCELVGVIVLYSLCISYFLIAAMGRYWEVALLLMVIGVAFIFYYQLKNKLLGEMQCVTCEVRSNLQKQLTTLEKYVRFYLISSIILTPVAYFATGFIVFFKTPFKNFNAESWSIILFMILGVILTVGSYSLNRWYVRKLYGKYILQLKELLRQMEEKEV